MLGEAMKLWLPLNVKIRCDCCVYRDTVNLENLECMVERAGEGAELERHAYEPE
jgi:hypothetical protein